MFNCILSRNNKLKQFKKLIMKTLTATAVLEAAEKLIDENGSTTTLEIKMALRADDYFAIQSEVSDIMFNNIDSLEFEINFDSGHRVYSKRDPSLIGSSQSIFYIPSPASIGKKPKFSYKDVTECDPKIGAWKAYSNQSPLIRYFESDSPEYAVRLAYSKLFDIPFAKVCAKHVK